MRPFHLPTILSGGGRSGSQDARFEVSIRSERSGVRRQTIASASSLSVSRNEAFPSPDDSLWWWSVGFSRRSVRGEYQIGKEWSSTPNNCIGKQLECLAE